MLRPKRLDDRKPAVAPVVAYDRVTMAVVISPRPADTSAEAERVQIDLLRAASVPRRVRLAWSLSATVIGLARQALARAEPRASRRDLDLRFVELHYGADLAAALRHHLTRQGAAAPPDD